MFIIWEYPCDKTSIFILPVTATWLALILILSPLRCTLTQNLSQQSDLCQRLTHTLFFLIQCCLKAKETKIVITPHLPFLILHSSLSQHFCLRIAHLVPLPPPLLSHDMPQRDTIIHFIWVMVLMVETGLLGSLWGWWVAVIVNVVMSVEWPQCSTPQLQVTHTCPPPLAKITATTS